LDACPTNPAAVSTCGPGRRSGLRVGAGEGPPVRLARAPDATGGGGCVGEALREPSVRIGDARLQATAAGPPAPTNSQRKRERPPFRPKPTRSSAQLPLHVTRLTVSLLRCAVRDGRQSVGVAGRASNAARPAPAWCTCSVTTGGERSATAARTWAGGARTAPPAPPRPRAAPAAAHGRRKPRGGYRGDRAPRPMGSHLSSDACARPRQAVASQALLHRRRRHPGGRAPHRDGRALRSTLRPPHDDRGDREQRRESPQETWAHPAGHNSTFLGRPVRARRPPQGVLRGQPSLENPPSTAFRGPERTPELPW
jgi:hypothetical protein